jgi:hypothetical protein
MTYFNPKLERPKLFCNTQLMHDLWESSLRGGLDSIQGKVVTLTEYFDCRPVDNSESFVWEGITFVPVQTVHVMAGYHIKYSYGLLMRENYNHSHDAALDTMLKSFGGGSTGAASRMALTASAPHGTGSPLVFFTTDTQFCPRQIEDFYRKSDLILQDCETSPFKSGVHAHFDDLKTLSPEIKRKMWLYHYQPHTARQELAVGEGFAGFVDPGQQFDITV